MKSLLLFFRLKDSVWLVGQSVGRSAGWLLGWWDHRLVAWLALTPQSGIKKRAKKGCKSQRGWCACIALDELHAADMTAGGEIKKKKNNVAKKIMQSLFAQNGVTAVHRILGFVVKLCHNVCTICIRYMYINIWVNGHFILKM